MEITSTLNSPRIINNKKSNSDGSIDFLSTYVKFNDKENIPIIANIYVTTDLVGRLDIIAQRFYGTVSELDLLLKFNEIDDMFAVPVGKQILVPDKYALINACSWVNNETQYSLDNNKSLSSFANQEDILINDKETVENNRTVLKDRGAGYTTVAPGVLKF